MAPSPAWQTLMRGRGARLGQDSSRPLAGPAARAASPCGGDGCCFDTATVSETLVLTKAFVKQCDQPGAPPSCAGQETPPGIACRHRLPGRPPSKRPGSGCAWQTPGLTPRPQQRCPHERRNRHGRSGHLRPRSRSTSASGASRCPPSPNWPSRSASAQRGVERSPAVDADAADAPATCSACTGTTTPRAPASPTCRRTWCCPRRSPAWRRRSSWCSATASR